MQPPFYSHYTGQPAFYCPCTFAEGNQRIRIREKTLKFSTVLSTLSPYLHWLWIIYTILYNKLNLQLKYFVVFELHLKLVRFVYLIETAEELH